MAGIPIDIEDAIAAPKSAVCSACHFLCYLAPISWRVVGPVSASTHMISTHFRDIGAASLLIRHSSPPRSDARRAEFLVGP